MDLRHRCCCCGRYSTEGGKTHEFMSNETYLYLPTRARRTHTHTHTTVGMTIGGGRARPRNVSIVSRGGGGCESRRDDDNNNNNDDDDGNNNNSYYGEKNSLYRNMMSITNSCSHNASSVIILWNVRVFVAFLPWNSAQVHVCLAKVGASLCGPLQISRIYNIEISRFNVNSLAYTIIRAYRWLDLQITTTHILLSKYIRSVRS